MAGATSASCGLNDKAMIVTGELLCHRCGAVLEPGKGNFYIVRIESLADPAPPHITAQDLATDIPAQIDELLAQLHDASERELCDQVYRRVTLHLCRACYEPWIENPAG
jgi:hypothetical protein